MDGLPVCVLPALTCNVSCCCGTDDATRLLFFLFCLVTKFELLFAPVTRVSGIALALLLVSQAAQFRIALMVVGTADPWA